MEEKVLTMTKLRIVLAAIILLSVAVLEAQRPNIPPRKPGMTDEEYGKEIQKAFEQARQQKREKDSEHIRLMFREAWKRELRISEQQWKSIFEPRINKVQELGSQALLHTSVSGVNDNGDDSQWERPSREGGPMSGKTCEQMPEGYRIIEEFIDLLEDENSKDEDIRQKMAALQKIREEARKELAEVGKELAALSLTPRQETVFLIMGYID